MGFITNIYSVCCIGYLLIGLAFYWSYFEYSDRLNYHLADDNQFKCLFNSIRKYYMSEPLDLLMGPTILVSFTLMFLKKIIFKFYMMRFLLFFPGCAFIVQLLFLSYQPTFYKQLGEQFQLQMVLGVAAILAMFFASAKTLYFGLVGGLAMSYILSGMIVEEEKNQKKEFTSVVLCSFIGVAFITILYQFAKDQLKPKQLNQQFYYSIISLATFLAWNYLGGWESKRFSKVSNMYANGSTNNSQQFMMMYIGFLNILYIGGGLNVNLLTWISIHSFKPFYIDDEPVQVKQSAEVKAL